MTSSLGLRQVGAGERGEVTRKIQESGESPRECEGRQPPWAPWGPLENAVWGVGDYTPSPAMGVLGISAASLLQKGYLR